MKTMKFLFVFLLVMLGSISYAQYENFNLSSYKLPDVKYKTLGTSFNLLTNYNNNFKDKYNDGFNFNSNFYGDYSSYSNNSKRQSELYLFTGFSLGSEKFKSSMYEYRTNFNFSGNLGSRIINRYYFRQNRFFETDLDFSFYDQNSANKYSYSKDTIIKREFNNKSIEIFIPIKYGFGRIERVEDARQAVLILQELSKIDSKSLNKSDDEILKFARKISSLKKERILDNRTKRLHELESIDSFLVDNGYISNKSMSYFTKLMDMMDYGALQNRNSGNRFSVGFIGGFTTSNNTNSETNQQNYNRNKSIQSYNFELKYDREKPVNLKWQNSFSSSINTGIQNSRNIENPTNLDSSMSVPYFRVRIDQSVGYYPNTRTSIELGYAFNYAQLYDNPNFSSDKGFITLNGNNLNTSIFLNLVYYFSPHLQLNINSNLILLANNLNRPATLQYSNYGSNNFSIDGIGNSTNESWANNNNQLSVKLLYTIF